MVKNLPLGARSWRVLALVLACGCATSSSLVQSAGAGAVVTQPGAERESAEEFASRALSRVAVADLKLARPAQTRDVAIAAHMLEIALTLTPGDEHLIRLLVEAHSSLGNDRRVTELTRILIGLDASDTVAQLRLISGRVSALQSVDERLAAYDRFLGPQGASLDAAIRSRLSLDAALLQRERGNLEAFADRLNLAIELDPTNKDAATLAYTFFAERVPDAAGRLDLLLSVLYSDPFDASVHKALARELASGGAYTGADRFLKSLARLNAKVGITPDEDEQTFRDVVEWNRRGADSVVRRLTDQLDAQRKDVIRKRQSLTAARVPLDDVPQSDDIRLPLGAERVRLLAATASGAKERAATSMAELAESARRLAEQLADPLRRPDSVPESEVVGRIQEVLGEVVWLRLWSGQQLDEAISGMNVLRKDPKADPATRARMEAWLLLRRGELDQAEQALTAIAPTDPFGELGLATLHERRNDKKSAIRVYASIASRFGADLIGAFARSRVIALVGVEMPLSETAKQLESIAAGVPDWVEGLIDNPHRIATLDVEPERSDVRLMEPTHLNVRITNVAPIPLAVGPDKPISSRFLFAPVAEVLAQPMANSELIEVASLDRRLRLLPRESFESRVWADAGQLGLLLDMSSSGNTRVRWHVLQGFQFGINKTYEAGPFSAVADTPMLLRRPSVRFVADAAALQVSLETGGPREIGETILTIRARQARTTEVPPLQPRELDALYTTLARRFSSLDHAGKLMVLALTPTALVQAEAGKLDEVAATDKDPDVLSVLLTLRLDNPDDPAFSSPSVASNKALSELAASARARLREGARTYSTLSSDVKPAIPPLIGPPLPEDPRELR